MEEREGRVDRAPLAKVGGVGRLEERQGRVDRVVRVEESAGREVGRCCVGGINVRGKPELTPAYVCSFTYLSLSIFLFFFSCLYMHKKYQYRYEANCLSRYLSIYLDVYLYGDNKVVGK